MKTIVQIDNKTKYFLIYSMAFLMTVFIIFGGVFLDGKTLVVSGDTIVQHYPFMVKVKHFYEGILQGKGIRLIDFNNYFGIDVFSGLNYYGLGNPLYLLTIGWPDTWMPYIYTIIFLLKLYLAGMAFSALCFQYKKHYYATLVGAVIYAINPFVIYMIDQICFMDILYQLPLLVIGFNQILRGKKSKIFVFSVMITALNGFYFLYMATLMLALYGIIYICKSNIGVKKIVSQGVKKICPTIWHYVLGLMFAAPVFLPTLLGFLQSYRNLGGEGSIELLYDFEKYRKELQWLLIYNGGTLLVLNFWQIVVLGILIFQKKYYFEKLLIFISVIGVQLPIVGTVMNGFSYSSNRWLFGVYFIFAFVAVSIMSKAKKKQFLMAGIFILSLIQPFICTCFLMKNYWMSSTDVEMVATNSIATLQEPESRIDGDEEWKDNASVYYDVAKAQVYTSMIPKIIMNAQIEMDLSTVRNTSIIDSLDCRAELEALFNIKYYLTDDSERNVPYGFELVEESQEQKSIYINCNTVEFGYTYDSFLPETALEGQNGVSRSWNAMKYAIISEKEENKVNLKEGMLDEGQCIKAEIKKISRKDSKYVIQFDEIIDSEVYIKYRIKNKERQIGKLMSGQTVKTFEEDGSDSPWHINREYKMRNMGYFDKLTEAEIDCGCELQDIEIYYHSMENYEKQVEELNRYHMEQVVFGNNKITGTIDVPESRLLCLSVPHIQGWKAFVDGRETDIVTVNGMFMGVMLSAGEHTIEFQYFTPGLKLGIFFFGMAVAMVICFKVKKEKNKIKRRKSEENNTD